MYPGCRQVLADNIRSRTTSRAEFRCRHRDGRYIWLETVGNLLLDERGEPTGAVLSSRDITDRKLAEERLKEYDQRLQLAMVSADMAVFAQDAEGRYTWLHNSHFGLSLDQVRGKRDADLWPPEFAQSLSAIVSRAIQTGQRVREEVSLEAQGEGRFFDLIVDPVKNDEGETVGVLGASLEVTTRRRLEDQLHQSQKLEAIGSLAGGIAHDFNNLLTAILGYTDLAMEDAGPNSPVQQDLREIDRAARSAESLTRQLLIFSRKSVVRPVVLRLNDILTHFEKVLRRVVGEHIDFRIQPGEDLGLVKADPGQIEQVLMNLAINARDAMPSGGTLTLQTASAELDEAFARARGGTRVGRFDALVVSDTGVGMPPEVLAKIFDPFFTTKGPKGTGLGLATVLGIVQQAGGYVIVDSVPRRGSIFTVYLPHTSDAREPAALGAAPPVIGGAETVLFVEDSESIRVMAERALQRLGYQVLSARDASEALAHAERTSFDLIVTDLVMPGLSGRELAERLLASRPDLKVVYTSGFTGDAEMVRGIETGATPFVRKPYTTDVLARTVRAVLNAPPPVSRR